MVIIQTDKELMLEAGVTKVFKLTPSRLSWITRLGRSTECSELELPRVATRNGLKRADATLWAPMQSAGVIRFVQRDGVRHFSLTERGRRLLNLYNQRGGNQ